MIGRTLTHYKVIEELGAGGMGVVYKALDLRLDRHVALKILPPDRSHDDDRRARFLHEARAASALNDPHIVTIFDIFTTEEGTDVLVMEFVQGRTLRDILNEGPMPVAKALDIGLQVAEGVGIAHTAGIVHRDLKPGNVMVTERGRVKVLDFGLAKLVGSGSIADQPTISSPTTVAGMLLGTVDYMSPEQAKGDPIDGRSDVFSLGAMLYEMFTGARPFVSGHALGVLHEILYGTVVPPRSKRPELSPDIEAAVLRALERDLVERYLSMDALARDLRRARQDLDRQQQIAAVPPGVSPPPLPTSSPQRASGVEPVTRQPSASGRIVVQPVATERAAAQATVAGSVAAQDSTAERVATQPAIAERLGAASPGAPTAGRAPSWSAPSSSTPSWPAPSWPGASKGRTRDRSKKGRRSRLRTAITIVMVLVGINWVRNLSKPSHVDYRPPAAASRAPDNDAVGTAVEDAVASALKTFGPNSAGIQLARGKIYWKRAQKNGDAAFTKKAEDAFNEALRLNPDSDVADEARQALQEIADSKADAANDSKTNSKTDSKISPEP